MTGATTSYLQVSSNMAREVQGRLSVKAAQGNIKAKARGKAGGESQEEARRSGANGGGGKIWTKGKRGLIQGQFLNSGEFTLLLQETPCKESVECQPAERIQGHTPPLPPRLIILCLPDQIFNCMS